MSRSPPPPPSRADNAADAAPQTSSPFPAGQPSFSPPQPQATPQQSKKMASLEARITNLEQQISETEAQQKDVDSQLKTQDPQAIVKAHIKLLHDYNEIRDVGQGLMGIIADQRGVRVVDVYREFDVADGD